MQLFKILTCLITIAYLIFDTYISFAIITRKEKDEKDEEDALSSTYFLNSGLFALCLALCQFFVMLGGN